MKKETETVLITEEGRNFKVYATKRKDLKPPIRVV